MAIFGYSVLQAAILFLFYGCIAFLGVFVGNKIKRSKGLKIGKRKN